MPFGRMDAPVSLQPDAFGLEDAGNPGYGGQTDYGEQCVLLWRSQSPDAGRPNCNRGASVRR